MPDNTCKASDFRQKTETCFHKINGMTPYDIEQIVRNNAQAIIDVDNINAKIIDVVLVGSRARGLEKPDSDIDVVIALESDWKEYALFNLFKNTLVLQNIPVDINPIRAEESGTLEEYLYRADRYLTEKAMEAAQHDP